jgi:hypothetical protein
MTGNAARSLVTVAFGMAYWWIVAGVNGVAEPWDADAYWLVWYPVSFGLSAVLGLVLKQRAWIAGAAVTLAQLPVMLLKGGAGPLLPVGVLMLCVLSVPVIAVSALAGRLAARARAR